MFHKAVSISFGDGTVLDATFQDGLVKRFDMAALFGRYPQLKALEDRDLFTSGMLMGGYGIVWNDELDIEAETIYHDGQTVGKRSISRAAVSAGSAIAQARAQSGLTQSELAKLSGIDQSDISKIERGMANPSLSTLERIADALGREVEVTLSTPGAL